VDNLELLSEEIRADIIDFELFSKLDFDFFPGTTGPGGTPASASLYHKERDSSGATRPTSASYSELIRMERPSQDIFRQQLEFLNGYAALRLDREAEIVDQLDGPVPFMSSILYMRDDRTRFTLELLDTVLRLAAYVETRFKYALACKRPIEFSAQVQPMILTPDHGSLPSGHATEAFAVARVLELLCTSYSTNPYDHEGYRIQLYRQASRIAINRTVAGVHFPVDSMAGCVLGLALAEYFVQRAKLVTGNLTSIGFNGNDAAVGGEDFVVSHYIDVDGSGSVKTDADWVEDLGTTTVSAPSTMTPLGWLWDNASAEW
jgi:hypothetical protein